MPRPVLTDEEREQTRQRIRRAAAKLYSVNGKADLSARAIAKEAGVSAGTIYQYFENLRELMQSLWKEPLAAFLDDFQRIAETHKDPRRRLRKLLQAYLDFAHDEHELYRNAFLYIRPKSHPQPEPLPLGQDRLFSLLKQAVSDGQAEGVFRKGSAHKVTQLLWAGIHGSIALPTNIDRLAIDQPTQLGKPMLDLLMEWIEA